MELVSTMEINGEEREIADAVARGQIDGINSNLDGLGYGENAGGKNICKALDSGVINGITLIKKDVSTIIISGASGSRTISKYFNAKKGVTYTATLFTSSTKVTGFFWNNIKQAAVYPFGSSKTITFTPTEDETLSFSVTLSDTVSNVEISMQVEEGSKSTSFESYIPSVKMLAEENAQQSTEAMDLKMLGWSVPKECPIQNYVDSDGVFHQRVGRVDLGSLKYAVQTAYNRIITAVSVDSIKSVIATNLPNAYTDYCRTETSYNAWNNKGTIDRCLTIESSTPPDVSIYSPPSDLSELKGHYLYYELAEEKAFKVDGNEAVTKVNESLSVIGKCKNLLNPTLQTTTKNGVTCTNNGDGTYTLNGTNNTDSSIWFALTDFFTLEPNKKYKLVGGYPNSNRPFIDSEALWFLELYISNQSLLYTRDYGDGRVFATTETTLAAEIGARKGATFNNFTFKPMLTECLDATYDDFVPYTGDGDTLSADVAELKSDLSKQCKKDDITTNETLIGTFNGKNYYRKLFTGISGSGGSVTVNVGGKIEIYNYYGRAYTYGQSGASDVKYPIPNKNYYIDSQNASETSFQLTIPTSSDTRKVDLVIEYTKVDE